VSSNHVHHIGHFSWFFDRAHHDAERDVTRRRTRRPTPIDLTGEYQSNEDMLTGLYHGTWPGLQFASPLAFVPINVPVQMMGLPTPKSDDGRTQMALDEITEQMAERIPKQHRTALLVGTAWRWPRFDSLTQSLVWEQIKDSTIADILLNIVTGDPSAILTDEQFALSVDENKVIYVRRKRRFDTRQVTVHWEGQTDPSMKDATSRNIIGSLPIAFAHDADEGEIRGHSVLSRVIRDLKDYHDIDYMRSMILTKFRPKQIQDITDFKKWLENNGIDPDEDFDVAETDLIFNIIDKEKTTFEFLPSDATKPHDNALTNKFWKIYEGTGIPEMFWGGLATGNHATADVQMQQAVTYVDQLRSQWNKPYTDLYASSLRLLSIVRNQTYQPFTMAWNRLEAISADVKSRIFAAFAQALSQIVGAAAFTEKQLYTLWTLNYPESDPGTFEEFLSGITQMAKHSAMARTPYEMIFDAGGGGEGGASGGGEGGEKTGDGEEGGGA
jgi:hypothetical protein